MVDPAACCIQHGRPGPFIAINGPSLTLSLSIARVEFDMLQYSMVKFDIAMNCDPFIAIYNQFKKGINKPVTLSVWKIEQF